MEENKIVEKAIEELKDANETSLKEFIEGWFEKTRNQGLKIGAQYISAAIAGVIQKHLNKGKDVSRRDLERCIADIKKIISVQLTQQNDSEENNDGTVESD